MPNTAEMQRPQGFDIRRTQQFIPRTEIALDTQTQLIPGLERHENDKNPGAVVDRHINHFDLN